MTYNILKRRKKRIISQHRVLHLPFDPARLILAVVTVLILYLVMGFHFLPDRVTLRPGDISPSELRANRSVVFIDSEATANRRLDASSSVPNSYDLDHTAHSQSVRYVLDIFGKIRQIRGESSDNASGHAAKRLAKELGTVFSQSQLNYLLGTPVTNLDRLQTTTSRLISDSMDREIRSDTDDLAHVKIDFDSSARRSVNLKEDIAILNTIGSQALRPNMLYNRHKTDAQREAVMRNVRLVTGEIRPGDVILRAGEIFNQIHMDKCQALGLISPHIGLMMAISLLLFACFMVLLVGYYIHRAYPAIYNNSRLLFLLTTTVILSVFGVKLFGALLGIPISGVQFGYMGMMTVVAAGMLITVLLNMPIAVLVCALLSMQSGLMMNHEIRFTVMTLISSLMGIYSASLIRNRGHLLMATIALAITNLAVVWMLGGLLGDTIREIQIGSAWALASAAFAIAIFWFGVAVLEKPFGILTHVWLLELSASEHPLLRKLCTTAPATYAHSIMVGNLAEAAAEAIDANQLFCRVASYYHDIGKIRRPHCFVENQRTENIHDRLNPSLSSLIIASHVRDGMELADEYKLPVQIKSVIVEHHGTSLIRYFYHQALQTNANGVVQHDSVLEQHFRYDGPRPQTRESGIIMLADSVEAAARCQEKPSPARLQNLIHSIVHDRVEDGQLDECDLTFKDLQLIQSAFVHVLSAIMHGRIDYPELPRAHALHEEVEKQLSEHGGIYPEFSKPENQDRPVATSGA